MITSAEEFRTLRESEDPVEYSRAGREEASLEVWREVIARFPDLKVWVVYNKTVPLEILRELARDEDATIRGRVADRRKLDEELFLLLAGDPMPSVRGSIATNAKVPRRVLELLQCDPDEWVASAAKEKLAQRFGGG